MNLVKKNLVFVGIGLVSLLLAALALLTAFRLREQAPVAPTVPQTQPQALEGSPVPECQVSFSITLPSPSPSPSGTPSPTPTPTPVPQCNDTCTSNSQCPSNLVCSGGFCRNSQCLADTDCICAPPTPTPSPSATPSPTPSGTPSPTPSGIPGPTPTPTPTPTASPVAQCNDVCSSNSQCPSSMVCYITSGNTSGYCRNAACQTESDCICNIAQVNPTPTPTPSVTPTVPVAGTSWPTIFLIIGGMALLVLGFAL